MEAGKLTISQIHTNINSKDYIQIQLTDTKHRHKVQIDIDLKEFAQALTGLGNVDCEYFTFKAHLSVMNLHQPRQDKGIL